MSSDSAPASKPLVANEGIKTASRHLRGNLKAEFADLSTPQRRHHEGKRRGDVEKRHQRRNAGERARDVREGSGPDNRRGHQRGMHRGTILRP